MLFLKQLSVAVALGFALVDARAVGFNGKRYDSSFALQNSSGSAANILLEMSGRKVLLPAVITLEQSIVQPARNSADVDYSVSETMSRSTKTPARTKQRSAKKH